MTPGAVHRRRLRQLWRSAGWPCHDAVEAELLAGGWLQRAWDAAGRETLRVTDAGVALIAQTTAGHRRARDAHEQLVGAVVRAMQREGRIAWRGLSLRAPPDEAAPTVWPMTLPDVFSIRHTSREDLLAPIVHEVKVRRADLLSDLRHAGKREAYRRLAGQCCYVLKAGIATPAEVPPEYGVWIAHGDLAAPMLECARLAPAQPVRLPFPVWMALARAAPVPVPEEPSQPLLAGAEAADTLAAGGAVAA
jgi:hypothetical protein